MISLKDELILTLLNCGNTQSRLEPSREIEKRSSYREFELSRVKLVGKRPKGWEVRAIDGSRVNCKLIDNEIFVHY